MRMLLDLRLAALLLDMAQVFVNLAFDASFLPGFTTSCFFLGLLVGLPTAFGEDPSFAG